MEQPLSKGTSNTSMLLAHRSKTAIVKEDDEDVVESPESLSPIGSPVRAAPERKPINNNPEQAR